MLRARVNPARWIASHFPRNQTQLETEARRLLKLVFWVVLLLPVVILPAYYLLLALLR